MAKRNYNWLPKPKKLNRKYGVTWNADGDATVIPLKRQLNDRSVRGSIHSSCCDCGLTHLYAFEVFRGPDGDYFLTKRAYRVYKRKGRRIVRD